MRRILAIRFARLGDIILLQPALAAIKASQPPAHITLMTGHRCAPLAEMSTVVDEVIAVDRVAMRDGPAWRALRDVKQLVSDVRSRHFDVVIDFHSFRETNLLTWFSRAPVRIGMKRFDSPYLGFCFNRSPIEEDKSIHVAEMFQRVAAGLDGVHGASLSGSILRVPDDLKSKMAAALPRGPKVALYIDAPVAERRWPVERFAAVADHMVDTLAARPLILASPENPGLTAAVLNASRSKQLLAFADLSLQELAAAIESCDLLISNDTGPMHLGPALGVRTLGLFSVGLPEHFRPIGHQDQFLKGLPIETISVKSVIAEVNQMWAIAGRGPRR